MRPGRERLQIFDFAGTWVAASRCPAAPSHESTSAGWRCNGVGTLAFLGNGIALNQPETGALITEYGFAGRRCAASGAAGDRT